MMLYGGQAGPTTCTVAKVRAHKSSLMSLVFSLNSNGKYEWSNLLSRGMIRDKPNHSLWGGG